MDIEEELISVLNNPQDVWSAIVDNLEADAKTSLLVFTTCTTPVSMTRWQEAVARVSTDAAVNFLGAVRILDDMFIKIEKSSNDVLTVDFRNPSMDDFCANYLDAHSGMAVTVASKDPANGQIKRLLELGTASEGGRIQYRSLNEALVRRPSLLLDRCLDILPPLDATSFWHRNLYKSVATLIGNAQKLGERDLARVNSALAPRLLEINFRSLSAYVVEALFADSASAKGLKVILADDFDLFYERLWRSAQDFGEWDSMVTLDRSLGWSGFEATWRDAFIECADDWRDREYENSGDAETDREYYERVAEHLDLMDYGIDPDDWDERISWLRAEVDEPEPAQEPDESWQGTPDSREGGSVRTPGHSAAGSFSAPRPVDEVAAMFDGLTRAERPEE